MGKGVCECRVSQVGKGFLWLGHFTLKERGLLSRGFLHINEALHVTVSA